jgi:hypothetical protein
MNLMRDTVTRRAFVARSAAYCAMLVRLPKRQLHGRAPITLRLGVVAPLPRDQQLGLELGLDEARHAATLFGGTILDVPLATPQTARDALSAIIGGGNESSALAWIHHAAQSDTIYMNVGATSDRLRGADCSRAAFHVVPSDAMARDAEQIAGAAPSTRVEAWDSSLSRFGADTLNQRFLTRFHAPMTSGAWAAWFAVKALWESALRQQSGAANRIAEYLVRDTTQFDGHKGSPLSFRAWDHQLRQPLYVVAGGATRLTEVPQLTGAAPIRDALDRLGGATPKSMCGKGNE